jgi:hypothetical protein
MKDFTISVSLIKIANFAPSMAFVKTENSSAVIKAMSVKATNV